MITTEDGLRLRMADYPPVFDAAEAAPLGQILIATGRTEFIERYDELIARQCRRGWRVSAFDWRGQGASDRLLDDPVMGHVLDFEHYQRDLRAVAAALAADAAPQPWVLFCHSMGGAPCAIALADGAPFAGAAFSAPMLWLQLSQPAVAAARALSWSASLAGLGRFYAPGGGAVSYLERQAFAGNTLTSDPDRYAEYVARQEAEPLFRMGGPSLDWLAAAFRAMAEARRRAPEIAVPAAVVVSDADAIISSEAAIAFGESLPAGAVTVVPGAGHEPFMEAAAKRRPALAALDALLDRVLAAHGRGAAG